MKKFLVVENIGCRNEDDMYVNTVLNVLGEVDTVDEAFDLGIQILTEHVNEQFDYLLEEGDEEGFNRRVNDYLDCIEKKEVKYTDDNFPVMTPVPVLDFDWTDEYDYYRAVIQVQVIKLK